MGGYWAYKTLGWGGYWGWDPVENASLIPWLLGTALLHGLLHGARQAGATGAPTWSSPRSAYLSVLYGTFLTRSGVLADFSVHSFVDLGISGWLIALMAFFILALDLRCWRPGCARSRPSRTRTRCSRAAPSWCSRRSRCSPAALVVTVGTSAPLLTRFMANPGQVGPEFYNRVNLPHRAAASPSCSRWCPTSPGAGRPAARLLRQLAPARGVRASLAAASRRGSACAIRCTCSSSCSPRSRSPPTSRRRSPRCATAASPAAGGYLAHVGVGIILIGILASSAYDESAKVTLEQGEPAAGRGMTLTFEKLPPPRGPREGARAGGGRRAATGSSYRAYPRLFLNDRTRQLMVHPHIESLAARRPLPLADRVRSRAAGGLLHRGRAQEGGAAAPGRRRRTLRRLRHDGGANPMAQMASGGPVTISAVLQIGRGGATAEVRPVYRFQQGGRVEFPARRPAGRRPGGDRRHRRLRRRGPAHARRRRPGRRRGARAPLARRHPEAADRAGLGRGST